MTQWILTSSVLILLVLAVRGLFKNRMKAKAVYALWLLVLVRLLCPINFGEVSFNLLSLSEKGKAQIEERLELKQAEKLGVEQTQKQVYYPPGVEKIEDMQTEEASVTVTWVEGNTVAKNPELKTEVPVTVPELKYCSSSASSSHSSVWKK